MPGSEDRTPSAADRPPASRVGDELQGLADAGPAAAEDAADLEAEARRRAAEKGWDQAQTDREGGES